jgi:hypothetical protein
VVQALPAPRGEEPEDDDQDWWLGAEQEYKK